MHAAIWFVFTPMHPIYNAILDVDVRLCHYVGEGMAKTVYRPERRDAGTCASHHHTGLITSVFFSRPRRVSSHFVTSLARAIEAQVGGSARRDSAEFTFKIYPLEMIA